MGSIIIPTRFAERLFQQHPDKPAIRPFTCGWRFSRVFRTETLLYEVQSWFVNGLCREDTWDVFFLVGM